MYTLFIWGLFIRAPMLYITHICDWICQNCPYGLTNKDTLLPIFNGWMHKLTIQVCSTANGPSVCFYPGLFLRPVSLPWVLGWSLNGCILPSQESNQLGISTWLAGDICHWFGYILWYVEFKTASIDAIWPLIFLIGIAVTPWLPTALIGELVLLTILENRLSKMVGNSASYPCKRVGPLKYLESYKQRMLGKQLPSQVKLFKCVFLTMTLRMVFVNTVIYAYAHYVCAYTRTHTHYAIYILEVCDYLDK